MTTKSPIGGVQGRVPLVTALLVVGVLFAEFVITALVNLPLYFSLLDPQDQQEDLRSLLLQPVLMLLGVYLPIGIGMFLALRYITPVGASDTWRRVIRNAVIAAAIGAALLFVFRLIEDFAPNITPPQGGLFGYGGPISVTISGGGYAVGQALVSTFTDFCTVLPLVVVAVGGQKLWLARHPVPTATDRASAAGKP